MKPWNGIARQSREPSEEWEKAFRPDAKTSQLDYFAIDSAQSGGSDGVVDNAFKIQHSNTPILQHPESI
jgi:hypothetical protein